MAKSKKVQEENEDSGAAAGLLGIGLVGIGVWAYLRSRKTEPASSRFLAPGRSQVVATRRLSRDVKAPLPQFGYTDRAAFGFAF